MLETMAALFPEGRPSLLGERVEGEVAACLSALAAHPRAAELMSAAEGLAEDGFWPDAGSWLAAYRPYVVRDGVLQIPVKGVLLAELPYALGSYATGYPYIRRAVDRGMADATVRGIAFLCDTPGGEVKGNFDLVDAIFAYRGRKPMRAFAHDRAYSAGYSIASAADRIVVSRTGGVGSIGVVTSHTDASGALEKAGLKITFVHAGKHKVDGNSTGPLDAETKARWQARIDDLMSVFVATVVRNRGLSEEAVRGTQALTFTATAAVENGLADMIGSLDDAVTAFAAELSPQSEDDSMISQEAHDKAVADARASGVEEGKAAGAAEGSAAAYTRIGAILADAGVKGRESAAIDLAIASPGMSAEAVAGFVAKHGGPAAGAAANAGSRLDAVMTDPQVSTDAGEAPKGSADTWDNVLAIVAPSAK